MESINIIRNEQKRKKVKLKFRMEIKAQEAKAIAPLSPTLGQYGLSSQDFCKEFNDKTSNILASIPVRIIFFVCGDREFIFKIKEIRFSFLIENIEMLELEKKNRVD